MAEHRPVKAPEAVLALLRQFHQISDDQEAQLRANGGYDQLRAACQPGSTAVPASIDDLMRDKFIALESDKAAFVYNLVRGSGALAVVEAGTSFGVSTIYLALAVGQNAAAQGKKPGTAKVIATEYDASKAKQARKYWHEAGETVLPWIELREGDLLQTLRNDVPELDFVLFDIWTPVALPTLKLLEPHFRPGTTLVVDNVINSEAGYTDFFRHIDDGPYTSVTLPYSGGLAVIVYNP